MARFLREEHIPIRKVCGITRLEDALVAIEAGANALGFNFYPPSPRFIPPLEAEKIIARLPGEILTFAVVVHSPVSRKMSGGTDEEERPGEKEFPPSLGAVQVHGVDQAAAMPVFTLPILAAVSPETADDFIDYDIIVDTSWGRGKMVDWEKTRNLQRPYILSGGLNVRNIEAALEMLDPAGVDVCSGVESKPGVKDPVKLRAFLRKTLNYYENMKR